MIQEKKLKLQVNKMLEFCAMLATDCKTLQLPK